jgi:glucose uptake protein GlcU
MRTEIIFGIVALLLVVLVVRLTSREDGTLTIGCSNVAKTRGGTICLDKAYMR